VNGQTARAVPDGESWLRNGEWETLSLQLLSFTVEVTSNCPEVLDRIVHLYPAVSEAAPPPFHPSVRKSTTRFAIVKTCAETGRDEFELWRDRSKLRSVASAADALIDLDFGIYATAVPNLAEYVLVHAGVVASSTGAIVFPGVSRIGKSTLTAALCLAGFRCLSDELAIVDPQSFGVYPLRKPIRLREGGYNALLAAGFAVPPSPVEHTDPRDGHTLRYLVARGPDAVQMSVPVTCVLSLERRPGEPATLRPKPRALVLAELAERSFNLSHHGIRAMETWARLLEGAACYTLVYDDLREAVATIKALADNSPPQ
jgi:hypothetical protein